MTREQKKSIEQTMKLLAEVVKSDQSSNSLSNAKEILLSMKSQFPIQAKRIFSR